MFQDIAPHTLNIGFINPPPADTDYLICYQENRVLVSTEEGVIFPTLAEIRKLHRVEPQKPIYLFDMDGHRFYLLAEAVPETPGLVYHDIRFFRNRTPEWLCFGGATAMHLARWYENNRFCGKCAGRLVRKEDERALFCPGCGLEVYPRINPVVIVGIIDGDKILLVKNNNPSYKHYGLVAGFMEIGETLEETVRREVSEEVGLRVKNIRYYKSQPWAFSESILVGFYADVAGDTLPVLDGRELSEARWFHRDELPAENAPFSLTWELIETFRQGNEGTPPSFHNQ